MKNQETNTLDLPMQLTLTALNVIQKSNGDKQKMVNAATIQEGSTAQIVAENLYQEIINSTFPANIFKQSLYKCRLRVHPFGYFTFDAGCDICRQC